MTPADSIAELTAHLTALRSRNAEQSVRSLQNAAGELFEALPKLQLITWFHYTPDFEDEDIGRLQVTPPNFLIEGKWWGEDTLYLSGLDEDMPDEWSGEKLPNWRGCEVGGALQMHEAYDQLRLFAEIFEPHREFLARYYGDGKHLLLHRQGIEAEDHRAPYTWNSNGRDDKWR